ncbi:MAG TPA: hypothetical protein VMT51_11605 [Dongiaceae bacterium]|nr:hypothetical protein [Dongiaceae bacterium]
MWFGRKKNGECEAARDLLERLPEDWGVAEPGRLPANLAQGVRAHLEGCAECRIFADELLEVRGMLQRELDGPEPGPFFLKRVMAGIAEREARLEQSIQTWAAVPRLAYRFSVLASLGLLIMGSWLYERRSQPQPSQSTLEQRAPEGLVGGTPVQDDFYLNTTD